MQANTTLMHFQFQKRKLTWAHELSSAMSKALYIALNTLIAIYQYLISPLFPPTCRFYPSCSHYIQEALAIHGIIKGLYLAVRRILRCNPWHCGGHDPVPPPLLKN